MRVPIQYFVRASTGWTARPRLSQNRQIGCIRRGFKVEKRSNEFGQYSILLTCACGHTRRCNPHTLAAFAGLHANLADIVRRLRCSKCSQKRCMARAVEVTKPRWPSQDRR